MKGRTLAEIYCEREGLPPAELNRTLFFKTLYPQARPFLRFVRWLPPGHFLADHEFCKEVGNLRSLEDFALVLASYIEHPSNRRFLRGRLRIRVSARRMFRIVRTVFEPGGRVAAPRASQGNAFGSFDKSKQPS